MAGGRRCLGNRQDDQPVKPPEPRGLPSQLRNHCPRGDPYQGDSLYIDPKGDRRCRACKATRWSGRRSPEAEAV